MYHVHTDMVYLNAQFSLYIFSATLILQCCIDENSQSALALKVNKQLKGFAAARLGRTERLIDR